ncbi:sel1 repeat family protein, partial [Methylobacterium sp. WL93]|uniref:tetratricopeptide repeat protein n=4 Tax=unclassified Methylobacterium TaxID=2615210 RepID=UPI0011CC9B3A
APADPQTTQALATAAPAEAKAAQARSAVPQVSSMASLAGDLATLPAGLSKLRQAAQDGDGTAVWELAGRAADGRGLPRDLSLAAKLYEKLAGAGYAPAQYKYAGHYEKGAGLVRDLDKAKMWYGRAAEQGHARSMHNLAVIYAENPSATGKPDYASAASWFRQGAEYGVRDSQYNLAVLYARGLGLTQDLAQSYAWFAAAAAQGDEDAGKKRDDVATKLSPADLAAARSIAANFKPHRLDRAVNEPPVAKDAAGPMTLLGAPAPIAPALGQTARKGV